MTNVLYMCPEEGCGARLFAPPGGTKVRCNHHQETYFQQVEASYGTDYQYKGETGEPSRVGQSAPNLTAEDDKIALRAKYEELTGQKPDLRWGEKTLREEIEAALGTPDVELGEVTVPDDTKEE